MLAEMSDFRYRGVELDGYPVSLRECSRIRAAPMGRQIAPYPLPRRVVVDETVMRGASRILRSAAEDQLERQADLRGRWVGEELFIDGISDVTAVAAERRYDDSITLHEHYKDGVFRAARKARYTGSGLVGTAHVHLGGTGSSAGWGLRPKDVEFLERMPAGVEVIISYAPGPLVSLEVIHCEPFIGKVRIVGTEKRTFEAPPKILSLLAYHEEMNDPFD